MTSFSIFLKFSPATLLIILYQLTRFQGPSYNSFQDNLIWNFPSPNMQKAIHVIKKNTISCSQIFTSYSLIILYQLTKFQAPSYNSFRDILVWNFQSPNLQRAIIRKNIMMIFFFKFSTDTLLIFSISWPSFKLLAILVLEISPLQDCILPSLKEA